MEVDSSMASQTNQDPVQNNSSPSTSPMEKDAEQSSSSQATSPSSSSQQPSPPSTPPVQQHAPMAGPRCAPTYTVVNANMEKEEDGPGPRCGHTLTAVPPVGEEGTPGYIGLRLILFGGATALEGNPAASETPSSAGIRLAGATADIHCYDVLTNKWTRINLVGEAPAPRAAHVATAVGTMVVIRIQQVCLLKIFMYLTLLSRSLDGIGLLSKAWSRTT